MKQKGFSLKEQAGLLFAGKVIGYGIQFLLPIILVRLLNRESYGLYKQALLLFAFFSPILQLGLVLSLYYFYPNAGHNRNQLLTQSYLTLVTTGLFFIPLFMICKVPIANFFRSEEFITFMVPLGLFLFLTNTSVILDHIFILEKKSNVVFFYTIAERLFFVVIIISFILIFKSIVYIIWSLVVFASIKSICLAIYLFKNYKLRLDRNKFNSEYFYSQIRYSYPLALAGLVGDIGRKFDQFILAAFIHPSGFALYAVAKFQIPLIMLFYKSVGNVTLPKISEYSLQGKTEKVIELWHKVICYYGSITIPLVTFFVVMAKPIITLIYTDQYVGSVNIFRIMIFVLFIQMFSFGTIPKAYKATKFILLSNFVAMISGTLLGYILIKYFGLYGGAISFLISIYITGSMQLVKSKKLLKLRFGQWLPWKFLGMIVMLALLCSLTLIPILNFPIPKLLRIAIGALIYFSLLAGLFEKLSIFSVRTFLAKKWAHQLKGIFSNRFSHRTEGD